MAPIKPEPLDDPAFGLLHEIHSLPTKPAEQTQVQGLTYLQHLISLTSPEVLERGVAIGLQVLDGLQVELNAAAHLHTTDASQWLKQLDDLRKKSKPTRTVIGVLGGTGTGKSSVISAVLDEERYAICCIIVPDVHMTCGLLLAVFWPQIA